MRANCMESVWMTQMYPNDEKRKKAAKRVVFGGGGWCVPKIGVSLKQQKKTIINYQSFRRSTCLSIKFHSIKNYLLNSLERPQSIILKRNIIG
mgnify:CR=1 FL=1